MNKPTRENMESVPSAPHRHAEVSAPASEGKTPNALIPEAAPPSLLASAWRYGLAVVAVAASFGLRLALETWIGPGLPTYITFYPAVMAVALLGGIGPGLVATALTGVTTAYYILPPEGLSIAMPVDQLGLVIFVGMGVFMSTVAELYRRNRSKAAAYHREMALRESEGKYRIILETANEGIWITDAERKTIFVNQRLADMLGYTIDEVQGRLPSDFLAAEHEELARKTREQIKKGAAVSQEFRLRRKDGSDLWVISNASPVLDDEGRQLRTVSMLVDITARKQAEENLHRVNRALMALSAGNQAFMRAKDETAYLDEVSRIILDDCGHKMVWIGFAENDADKSVRPVVSAGFEDGYLETLRLTWADTERGHGPTGTAIRTGKPAGCENMLTDPVFAPWREEARKRGYASSVSLPLLADGKAFGAITVYSAQPDGFLMDEVQLLNELAADVAQGITSIRSRQARQRAEEALRESERRLRLAQDAAKAGTWEWNLQTNENVWSEEVCRLYGLDPSHCEQSYETWLTTIHPDDVARAERAVQEATRLGIEIDLEWRVRGTRRWLMSRGQPERDADGRVRHYRGIVLDITERKNAEEVLKRSRDELEGIVRERTAELIAANEELRAAFEERKKAEEAVRAAVAYNRGLIETTLDPLVTIGPRGRITDVNAATETATGCSRHELIGTDFSEYFTDPEEARTGYQQVFRDGLVRDYPLEIRHRNGSVTPVLFNASVYSDKAGRIIGVLAAARDITALKEAEAEGVRYQERLRSLATKLTRTEEEERRRISRQIHDTVIQTLSLSNIKLGSVTQAAGEAGLAKEHASLKTVRELINEAITECRQLMSDLTPPLLHELGLGPALDDLTGKLQKQNDVRFTVTDNGESNPLDHAMRGLVFQATRELIVNALKHAKPRRIGISTNREGEYIRVQVQDDGAGFDPSSAASRTPGFQGGFGLFNIRGRVEELGGRLDIASQPGRGTIATITIPLTTPNPNQPPPNT